MLLHLLAVVVLATLFIGIISRLDQLRDRVQRTERDVHGLFKGITELRHKHHKFACEVRNHMEANRKSHLHFDQSFNGVVDNFNHLGDKLSDVFNGLGDHLGIEWQDEQAFVNMEVQQAGWKPKVYKVDEEPKQRRRRAKTDVSEAKQRTTGTAQVVG